MAVDKFGISLEQYKANPELRLERDRYFSANTPEERSLYKKRLLEMTPKAADIQSMFAPKEVGSLKDLQVPPQAVGVGEMFAPRAEETPIRELQAPSFIPQTPSGVGEMFNPRVETKPIEALQAPPVMLQASGAPQAPPTAVGVRGNPDLASMFNPRETALAVGAPIRQAPTDIPQVQAPESPSPNIFQRAGGDIKSGVERFGEIMAQPAVQDIIAKTAMAITASHPQSGQYQLAKSASERAQSEQQANYLDSLVSGEPAEDVRTLSPELRTQAIKDYISMENAAVNREYLKALTEGTPTVTEKGTQAISEIEAKGEEERRSIEAAGKFRETPEQRLTREISVAQTRGDVSANLNRPAQIRQLHTSIYNRVKTAASAIHKSALLPDGTLQFEDPQAWENDVNDNMIRELFRRGMPVAEMIGYATEIVEVDEDTVLLKLSDGSGIEVPKSEVSKEIVTSKK